MASTTTTTTTTGVKKKKVKPVSKSRKEGEKSDKLFETRKHALKYLMIKTETTFLQGELNTITAMLEQFILVNQSSSPEMRHCFFGLIHGDLYLTEGIHFSSVKYKSFAMYDPAWYNNNLLHFTVELRPEGYPHRTYHFFVNHYNSRIINYFDTLSNQDLKIEKRYAIEAVGVCYKNSSNPQMVTFPNLQYPHNTQASTFGWNDQPQVDGYGTKIQNHSAEKAHRKRSRSRSNSRSSFGLPGKGELGSNNSTPRVKLKRQISDVIETENEDEFPELGGSAAKKAKLNVNAENFTPGSNVKRAGSM